MPEALAIKDCWKQIGVWGAGDCPELKKHVHCRNCPTYSAAAARLLDRALPPEYLDQWTNYLSEEKQGEESGTQSVVIFRISREWLALSSALFHEVMELRPMHSLPHRRGRVVLGLVNVRGELIVCVSLAEVLGIETESEVGAEKERIAHRRLLVVGALGQRLVFPVDEIHGIYRFHSSSVKETPSTVTKAAGTYTRGLLQWRDTSVGCLDGELLFYTLNKGLS